MNFKILYSLEFEKEIKQLAKKYPSLKKDFSLFLESLQQNPTQGVSLGNNVYKVRMLISSKNTGNKSIRSTITEKEIKERLKKYLP